MSGDHTRLNSFTKERCIGGCNANPNHNSYLQCGATNIVFPILSEEPAMARCVIDTHNHYKQCITQCSSLIDNKYATTSTSSSQPSVVHHPPQSLKMHYPSFEIKPQIYGNDLGIASAPITITPPQIPSISTAVPSSQSQSTFQIPIQSSSSHYQPPFIQNGYKPPFL